MKKSNAKVPQFDEIIFENRNKSYGAYDLRKRYKSTASISVLFGVSLCTFLVIALSLTPDVSNATDPGFGGVIITVDPVKPIFIEPEEVKPSEEMIRKVINNLRPVVADDSDAMTDYLPITEDIIDELPQRDVNVQVIPEIPEDPVTEMTPEPRVFVEEMPQYPGGDTELLRYIGSNLEYPSEAIANGVQGKVFIKFVVNADGTVGRIEVMRGVDELLDKEAVRVIGTLPRFRPGKQNGVAVPVWFTIPVVFKLEEGR